MRANVITSTLSLENFSLFKVSVAYNNALDRRGRRHRRRRSSEEVCLLLRGRRRWFFNFAAHYIFFLLLVLSFTFSSCKYVSVYGQ